MNVIGISLMISWILLYLSDALRSKRCYTVKDDSTPRGYLNIESKKLEVLLNEYEELRSELKQRISQRDNFAVQFVVSCCAVLALTA